MRAARLPAHFCAASALLVARAWLGASPGSAVRWGTRRAPAPAGTHPRATARAVEAAGARLHATCLEQGLALLLLLAVRRMPARLVIGVSRPETVLQAHAWVECGGEVILGAAEAEAFLPLPAAMSPCQG